MHIFMACVTAMYVAYLLAAGFGNRSVLGAWPMFSRVCSCHLYLTEHHPDGREVPNNPWHDVVHPGMTPPVLDEYLQFLHEVRGVRVSGLVEVVDSLEGSRCVRVEDNRVVVD